MRQGKALELIQGPFFICLIRVDVKKMDLQQMTPEDEGKI